MTMPLANPELAPYFEPIDDLVTALKAQASTAEAQVTVLQNALDGDAATLLDDQNQISAEQVEIAADAAEIAALTPKGPLLGVYNGGPTDDDATKASFGVYPDISSTYYQATGISGTNIKNETARIGKGISPLLTITTKGGAVSLNDVAAQNTAGAAWLGAYVTALTTLAKANPAANVYATIEHEFEVAVNAKQIVGVSNATYAKALSIFIEACNATGLPNLKSLYWYGFFDTTDIAAVLSGITASPDLMSLDPYSSAAHPATETFAQTVGPHIQWLRANVDYQRLGSPPILLSEFGCSTAHGDANCATWLADLRGQFADLGLVGGVLFNRNDPDYLISDGQHPLSVTAFKASLAAA